MRRGEDRHGTRILSASVEGREYPELVVLGNGTGEASSIPGDAV